MKEPIRIKIEIDDKVIGYADYMHIKKEKLYYSIQFSNCEIVKNINLNLNDTVDLIINYDTFLRRCFSYEKVNIKIGKNEKWEFKANLNSWVLTYSTNFLLELINSWYNKNTVFQWRSLSNLRKKVWIKACLMYNDIQTVYVQKGPIIFDGKEVKSQLDLFCYIGELFFGYGGYLGRGFDGVYDCLRSFHRKGLKIYFKNYEDLKSNIGIEDAETMIEIFKDCNIEVEILK